MAISRFLSKLAGLLDGSGKVTQSALAANVAGNGPAFSAYMNADQTVANATWTKAQFNAKTFDTANNFNTSTHRFTPTTAGYYQVNFKLSVGANTSTALLAALTKNGSDISRVTCYALTANQLDDWSVVGSALVYMNGSTDYLEVYGYVVSGTPALQGVYPLFSAFEAFLARSAT